MISYFISDLHLKPDFPKAINCFLSFLQVEAIDARQLFILGDFFDVWIGDDDISAFSKNIQQALANLAQHGVKLYFMPGNRDFLIGKKFFQQIQCTMLPDPYTITINNQKIVLTHGDLLCTNDKRYLKFRSITRSWLVKTLFLSLPLSIRQKIAGFLRAKSQQQQKIYQNTPEITDVTTDAVIKILNQHQSHELIHGHTHRPDLHHVVLSNTKQTATRWVLGDWCQQPIILKYDHLSGGELIKLKEI